MECPHFDCQEELCPEQEDDDKKIISISKMPSEEKGV